MVVHDPMSETSGNPTQLHDPSEVPSDEQLGYWAGQLAGVSAPQLPTDRPPRTGAPLEGGALRFALPDDVAASVRDATARSDVTVLDLAVAACHVLLARYAGADDIAVAIPAPSSGRPLVLRSRLGAATPLRDVVASTHATVLDALAHSDVPDGYLTEELGLDTEVTRAAVVCSELVLPFPTGLTVRLVDGGAAGFSGTIEFRPGLFAATTVDRLVDQLVQVLRDLTGAPDTPLGHLDLVTESERRVLGGGTTPAER